MVKKVKIKLKGIQVIKEGKSNNYFKSCLSISSLLLVMYTLVGGDFFFSSIGGDHEVMVQKLN